MANENMGADVSTITEARGLGNRKEGGGGMEYDLCQILDLSKRKKEA